MKPALVIMAAGIGSRYGGLKQIEPVGPSGEIMLDYSVFDARRAGFGKVVFVIRRDIEKDFRAAIGRHMERRVPVEYAFQELSDLPEGFSVPAERTKPWGTGHAIMRCSSIVKEPFAVINADDFYGKESYSMLCSALSGLSNSDNSFFMVGFRLANTLSDHGYVSRGICETGPRDMLISVTERLKIEKTGCGIRFEDETGKWISAGGDEIASMNMFGFTPAIFGHLEKMFPVFLKSAMSKPKAEFLLPTIVHELIREKRITMKVLKTPERWYGITYKQDTPLVVAGIRNLVDSGLYPRALWA